MKTLFVAINSQYIHSNLAVWYLKSACNNDKNITIMEFNINQQLDIIFSEIISEKPDCIAFSVYIWNIDYVFRLVRDIKKADNNIKIILGGPEVSYNAEEVLLKYNEYIDFINLGAGEIYLPVLLEYIKTKNNTLCYILEENNEKIVKMPPYYDFNDIKSPYMDEMLEFNKDKIIYYESSRGCPFSCSYCLSSCEKYLDYLNLDRVYEELITIVNKGYKLIKFVDRTFNANILRAEKLLEFIINETKDTVFHFEIAADILSDNFINILKKAQNGKIQLEIGIQTTNENTLEEINRKTDTKKVLENIEKLIALNNTAVHIDLIAGLPCEEFDSFKKSFNDIFSLGAHDIQLGFLKLLHGTKLRDNKEQYGMKHRGYPPYEVIKTKDISSDQLILLKKLEKQVDMFYNSHRFCMTINYLLKKFDSSFDLFLNLAESIQNFTKPIGIVNQYKELLFYCENKLNQNEVEIIKQLLRFDYRHINIRNKIPECINIKHSETKTDEIIEKSGLYNKLKINSRKELKARLYVEQFDINPITLEEINTDIIFDLKDISKIIGFSKYYII